MMCRSRGAGDARGGDDVTQQPDAHPPDRAAGRQRFQARIVPTREGHGVTTLELFFDLVFVFAITQVTALHGRRPRLAGRAPRAGAPRAAVVRLVQLRLAGQPGARRRGRRPGGRDRRHGGDVPRRARHPGGVGATRAAASARRWCWPARSLWSGCCTWPSTPSRPWATPTCAGSCSARRSRSSVAVALLVVGALIGGATQTVLWALALVIDYSGVYASGTGLAAALTRALRRAARPDHDHRAGGVDHRRRRRGARPAADRADRRRGAARPGGQRRAVVAVLRRRRAGRRTGAAAAGRESSGSGWRGTPTRTCTSRWWPASSTSPSG